MKLKIKDVYPGSDWQDICISGFRLLSGDKRVTLSLVVRGGTSIEWFVKDGILYAGKWQSDHGSGFLYVKYANGRADRIIVFSSDSIAGGPAYNRTYQYLYSVNKIEVAEESTQKVIVEYLFENGILATERRFGNNQRDTVEIRYTHGANGQDDKRDYFKMEYPVNHFERDGMVTDIIRHDYNRSGSDGGIAEEDIYEKGKLYRSQRSAYYSLLLPVDYLRINN